MAWGKDGGVEGGAPGTPGTGREGRRGGGQVVSRQDLPFSPASLACLEDGVTFLVGGSDGELLALAGETARPINGATGRGPTRVIALDGTQAAVASLWEGSIRIIDAASGAVARTIEVTFPVGAMVRRPDGRLIAADAFGNRLADVDPVSGRVFLRVIDGVNLRGLAISGDGKELLVAHAYQYESVPITSSNIDWGLVLSSRLSGVRLTEFDPDASGREGTVVARRRLTLDGSRHGAADPSSLAVSPDGSIVMIALSGAHQVLKNDRRLGSSAPDTSDILPMGHNLKLETLEVGRSPVAIVFDPSGERTVTANAMSDTLTVVKIADLSIAATIRLSPGFTTRTASQRGEAAFLDGRHGMDRWMTCASCHPAGHTSGLNFDTLGDGGYGASKNTPSLLGAAPTAPFAWTGRFPDLTDQVHQSLESSLRGPSANDEETIGDLAAYLQTLESPPPRRSANDPLAVRGGGGLREPGLRELPQAALLHERGGQERRAR